MFCNIIPMIFHCLVLCFCVAAVRCDQAPVIESPTNCQVTSVFAGLQKIPNMEVIDLTYDFEADSSPEKVNLIVGAYRTEENKPWLLPAVFETQQRIASNRTANHEYLLQFGNDQFVAAATALLLGQNADKIESGAAFGSQTLAGTGALYIGAKLLRDSLGLDVVYFSRPTYDNHARIFANAGFGHIRYYRYWDNGTRGINFDGLLADLGSAPAGAVVLLHVCGHNPTGRDPTREQWRRVADVIERRRLLPFFDGAYLGLVSGDVDRDAWPVRYFVRRGLELLCAQSFSKNFGLYGERIGNLVIVQRDARTADIIRSHLRPLIRGTYDSPARYGSEIVATVLTDGRLRAEWLRNVRTMHARIGSMRRALFERLQQLGTAGSWQHIVEQQGMFAFLGLSAAQSRRLSVERHVYQLMPGRINVPGLNGRNVDYVARAIRAVVGGGGGGQ